MTDMEAIERVREDLASLDKHHMKPVETVWHTSDVRALLSALDRKDEVIRELLAAYGGIDGTRMTAALTRAKGEIGS